MEDLNDIKLMLKEIAKEALEEAVAHSNEVKKQTDAEIAEIRKKGEEHRENMINALEVLDTKFNGYTKNVSTIAENYFFHSFLGAIKRKEPIAGMQFDDIIPMKIMAKKSLILFQKMVKW